MGTYLILLGLIITVPPISRTVKLVVLILLLLLAILVNNGLLNVNVSSGA